MKGKVRALAARFRPALKVAKVLYQNRKVELSIAASAVALIKSFLH